MKFGSRIEFLFVGLILLLISSACSKVNDNHEINGTWTFTEYLSDSVLTYDTLVFIKIENSIKVTGDGPQRHFRGDVEVWSDGSIQFSNLCCGDTSEFNLTLLPQLQFHSVIESLSSYEISGNQLTLTGPEGTMKFEK